jgi:hypothetical protein
MTLMIELAPDIEAELVRQAAEQGVGIGAYAASLLKDAAQLPHLPAVRINQPERSTPSSEVVDAVEVLKSFGKVHGLSLSGMTIRELRHEARP